MTTPRAADTGGLALAAARQQKVRTALTIIGLVVGTFTLVVSLSVGQRVERAIVALFHEDDRLRKIMMHSGVWSVTGCRVVGRMTGVGQA